MTANTLAPGVTHTPVDDGATLMHPDGTIFHLNRTGAAILTALLHGGPDAAVTAIIDRYDLDEPTANGDVTDLLATLRERNLIQ